MSFKSSKMSINNYNIALNNEITFSSPIGWIYVHVPRSSDHKAVTWLMLCDVYASLFVTNDSRTLG